MSFVGDFQQSIYSTVLFIFLDKAGGVAAWTEGDGSYGHLHVPGQPLAHLCVQHGRCGQLEESARR